MAPGQQDAHSRRRQIAARERGQIPHTPTPAVPHFALVPWQRSAPGSPAPDHDLTIVVPAFNEQQRLPSTLDGLTAYLDAWRIDYRVLVVDDGSSDGTAQLTSRYGSRFSTISQVNSGKGAAVRNGVLRATGRVVAFTDADLPYHLDSLRAAYCLIAAEQCDVVFGARDLKDSTVLVPRRFFRTQAHRIFSSIMWLLVSREVSDTQCGLKIFSRRAAVEIFSRTTINGFAFDAEVVFLTDRLALPFRRIPVTLINEYASTISLTRHALPMVLDVVKLRWKAFWGDYRLDRVAFPVVAAPAAHEQHGAAA
jgi:dolichyl-phosphate beta-glucosyltransferase